MPIIFIALAIVFAAFVPMLGMLAPLVLGAVFESFGHHPSSAMPAYLPILGALITYIPGAIISLLFIKLSKLRERLPSPIPGVVLMSIGLALWIVQFIALQATSISTAIQRSNVAIQIIGVAAWFAMPLLLAGIVKMLLAAQPNKSVNGTPKC
jgi:hypothetical protein